MSISPSVRRSRFRRASKPPTPLNVSSKGIIIPRIRTVTPFKKRTTVRPTTARSSCCVDSDSPQFQRACDAYREVASVSEVPWGRRPSRINPNRLQVVRTLGEGSHGQVFLTTLTHGHAGSIDHPLFALKVETKKAEDFEGPQQQHNERPHLTSLPWSPWVAGIIDAFHDHEKFFMLLELVPCGNLNSFLRRNGRLTAMQACFYFSNIVCALRFLHSHHIVHRDLKPGNILIGEDGYLVLGDFGCSKSVSEEKGWEFGGTPVFMAPEVVVHEPKCGPAVDWWAAGCILYQMLTGNTAFLSDDVTTLRNNILQRKLMWTTDIVISQNAKHLIDRLLTPKAEYRLGSSKNGGSDANAVMNHPWLRKVSWRKMDARGYLAPYLPPAPLLNDKYHDRKPPSQRCVPNLPVVEPLARCQYKRKFDRTPSPTSAKRARLRLAQSNHGLDPVPP